MREILIFFIVDAKIWDRIPFERALDFANKEKITELLYPLFVHNIGALLYHPTNSNRTNAVMAAAERRKLETKQQQQQQQGIIGPPGSQPPSLHHHHSMNNNPAASHVSQPPHSIAPHPGSRPNLDRAPTFPTPPTSASSGVGMSGSGNSYDSWGPNISGAVQSTQPLAIDTHAHSTPNTPATTPPGPPMQNMQPYQGQPPYDSSRPVYSSATTQQGQYAPQQTVQPQSMGRLGGPMQANPYLKHEMGPPTRAPGSGPEIEHAEHKSEAYPHAQASDPVGNGTGEEEADHEHDSEYPHDNNAAYNANRGSYNNYSSAPNLGTLQGEHPHLSPEMSGSPSHQNGSGRGTPRTSTGSQAQWTPGYHTPPRAPQSGSHYNALSDTRASVSNGTSVTDTYAPGPLPASYAPLHVNGTTTSNKRMREDDDSEHQSRPASRGEDIEGMKRRKLAREGSVSGPIGGNTFERDGRQINRPRAAPIPQRPRR